MLIDISFEATPKNVTRIGERPQGNRPLNVEFRDVVERDDIYWKSFTSLKTMRNIRESTSLMFI